MINLSGYRANVEVPVIYPNMEPEEIDSIIFQKSVQLRELIIIKQETEKRKKRLVLVK
jgi:hypothetical protein